MSPRLALFTPSRRAAPALALALMLGVGGPALAEGTGRIEGGLDAKKASSADNSAGRGAIPAPGSKIVVADNGDAAKSFAQADNAPPSLDQILIGDPDAPVTIIEYGSPTCGHCASFHNDVLPELKKTYIETGQAKLVFRPFMLNGADVYAALLVACVAPARQTAMLDVIFKTQQTWVPYGVQGEEFGQKLMANLRKIGSQAGLSDQKFDACMANQRNRAWLQSIMNVAEKEHKVNSTPTFVIGDEVYRNLPLAEFESAIAKATPDDANKPKSNFARGGQANAGRSWGDWLSGLFGG